MKQRTVVAMLLTLVLLIGLAIPSATAMPARQPATPPNMLTYQGHLLDDSGELAVDGTYQMTFSL
jgi:hypothetical protein